MKSVPLLEVAHNVTRGPAAFDGTKTYYATADVEEATLFEGTSVTYRKRPSRANLIGESGDILFAKMQATDKIVHVNKEVENALFSTGFFNFRPRRAQLDSRYLFWFLRSSLFQNEKDRRCTGATQKAITLAGLKEINIPLAATIPEQQRISSILDKADVIRRNRKQALVLADDFIRSVFLDMFGDPIVNSKNLPIARIKEFGEVVTGNTPPRKNLENYGIEIEWIKSDNINTPDHYLTESKEHLSEIGLKIGRMVPAGSTLVTCIAGSPSVIGNAALANRDVAFNQQINAVAPNPDTNPFFLYCQFLVGKSLIQANSTSSMKGMISKGKFQEIDFLKPDIHQQNEFGRVFEYYLESREKLQEASIVSQKLFGSLIQRAFRGEL